MIFFVQQFLLVLTSAVNMLIGAYVLIRNPKNIVNQSFVMLVVGGTIWGGGILAALIAERFLSVPEILFGGMIMIGGLVLVAGSFPHFSIPRWLWFSLLPLAILMLLIPFRVIIQSATISADGSLVPVNGPAFPIFAVIIGAYVALSFALFIKHYRETSGLERAQMLYFATGAIIFIALVFLFDVLLPEFGIFSLNFMGPLSSIVLFVFAGYAIIKHRLLDLRLVVARALSFFALLACIAIGYASIFLVFIQHLTGYTIDSGTFISIIALTTILMLSFQPIETAIRRLTIKLFFQNFYDGEKLLSKLTLIMATTIDLRQMTEKILGTLTEEIHIEKAAFFIIDNDHNMATIGTAEWESTHTGEQLLAYTRAAGTTESIWLFDDLEESPLKETFRTMNIALALPIKTMQSQVAILVLGYKRSGEIYYQNDIEFLKILASEAGIAIQNAKSYEAIKRFNEELEHTVEERTKELTETQARELAKAQAVARLKDEFVFIAAHELRTPVAAIKGFVQLASESKRKFSKETQHYMDQIFKTSDQLAQLINDLLEIARSETEKLKIETKTTSIVPIIESVTEELAPIAEKQSIQIVFKEEYTLPVLADESKLREVLVNLVGNAIKYNRKGGFIHIATSVENENLRVSVKDNGVGIPEADQPKIFQKFFRSQTSETKDIAGTGLGLFIARMLIERMGGTITFISTYGQGSTFSFSLPLAR